MNPRDSENLGSTRMLDSELPKSGAPAVRILHISGDFPDPLASGKTPAIRNLLAIVPEHEHRVYSLNRVGWRHGVAGIGFGEGHHAISYGAPPKGIALASRLSNVADYIVNDIDSRSFRPDVVHAHKLSIEGLVGDAVAKALGVPLVISSQGNTDLKIICARPDLRGRWRRIWQDAAVVFPFAPWTADGLTRLLGPRLGATVCLPCPTPQDTIRAPRDTPPVLRTAFHLAGHSNKNAVALMRATLAAAERLPDLRLEIIGGGDPEAFATLTEAVASLDPKRLKLIGPRPHDQMPDLFNASAAVPMPSKRESYGMALIEALMAGCPVLHSRGNGIDGYLTPDEVSIAVNPADKDELAGGLERIVRDQSIFKARLAALQESGGLDRFRRDAIGTTYTDALTRGIAPVDGT